jgi:hypothetical protein
MVHEDAGTIISYTQIDFLKDYTRNRETKGTKVNDGCV